LKRSLSGTLGAPVRVVLHPRRVFQVLHRLPPGVSADLERAWGAAVAGWVRARYLGERGKQLRLDLDTFVTQILLPEKARQQAAGADARPAHDVLQAQWDKVKRKYGID